MQAPIGQVVANAFRPVGLFLLKVFVSLWIAVRWLVVHLVVLLIAVFPLLVRLLWLAIRALAGIVVFAIQLFVRLFLSIFQI